MPHGVAQRLLDDPVGGQVHPSRQRAGGAADASGDRYARAPRGLQQFLQVIEARLGRGVRRLAAQHAEHPAQFLEAGQCASADLREALHQFLRRVLDLVGPGFGLDRDHGHVVGDDVVQLAGDALALFQQRALPLVPPLLDGELFGAATPGADDHADQDRDRGGEDGLRRWLSIDQHAAEHRDHARGPHHPPLTADRYRVQAQDVDENGAWQDPHPRVRPADPEQAERGGAEGRQREPGAHGKGRAQGQRYQHERHGTGLWRVLVRQLAVRSGEADERDDHVGDRHQVDPPAPQPPMARRRRPGEAGREHGGDLTPGRNAAASAGAGAGARVHRASVWRRRGSFVTPERHLRTAT